MSDPKHSKIFQLTIENFLGVRFIDIKPESNLVRIEGKNGSGKSSVVDAIPAALGGRTSEPPDPIRHGEDRGEINMVIGDFQIKKVFTKKGSYLYVEGTDGRKFSNPQEVLNEFFAAHTFDPNAFRSAKPKDRRELLLKLTGKQLEIEAAEKRYKAAYDERAAINREIKNMKGKLDGAIEDDGGDIAEVSVSELSGKLVDAQNQNSRREGLATKIESIRASVAHIDEKIKELQRRIDELVQDKVETEASLSDTIREYNNTQIMPVDSLKQQIADAEDHNHRVRDIIWYRGLRSEIAEKDKELKELSDTLKKIEAEKTALMSVSGIEVDNIKLDGDDLYIGDTIYDRLSTSEQITVALEIAMAFNPKFRFVRIQEGGELDSDTKAAVERFIDKYDCQAWVEIVRDKPAEGGFYISDGKLYNGDKMEAWGM